MAIVTSCCCGHSLRTGSFAAGIYSLGLYTAAITLAIFHVITVIDDTVLLGLNLLLLVCSGLCVPSSVLLLVGLCVDSRMFLLPWILCTPVTTLTHMTLSLYLFCDAKFHLLLVVYVSVDLLICALNVYCLLCVVSQYQEYLAGRGRQETVVRTTPSLRPQNLFQQEDPSKVLVTTVKDHQVATASSNLRPEDSCREDSTSKVNLYSKTSYVSEEDQPVKPVNPCLPIDVSNSYLFHPDTALSVSYPL
ncbi:uncharacterized protein LOC143228772 isoform X2 [Tachypleus tridentatus]|uniref:uncharacterized protein LOC143228772 isoform X2 n=1 Tax=Tachypleus tridentatus TaxID=6853 RepID=UPI003FCF5134